MEPWNKYWTADRVALLRKLYPAEPMDVILAAFPGKEVGGIRNAAYKHGVKRPTVKTTGKPVKIWQDIRARRLSLKLSIGAVAKRAGCARWTLSRAENGKIGVGSFLLAAVCEALGMEMRAVCVGDSLVSNVHSERGLLWLQRGITRFEDYDTAWRLLHGEAPADERTALETGRRLMKRPYHLPDASLSGNSLGMVA